MQIGCFAHSFSHPSLVQFRKPSMLLGNRDNARAGIPSLDDVLCGGWRGAADKLIQELPIEHKHNFVRDHDSSRLEGLTTLLKSRPT